MGYLIGYISGSMLLSFALVKFVFAKKYVKKHQQAMPKSKFITLVIGYGLLIMVFSFLSRTK